MVLAVATSNAGTWKLHNYYVTSKIQNLYDTGDKIYYMNSNSLFQFDKASRVTNALSRQNILSDATVSQIYYDHETKMLFVAYANSNIDIIDAEGTVTNIPNIKNMTVNVHHATVTDGMLASYASVEINDITFNNGIAYVVYGYGYLTIDESTKRVIKNYDLGRIITMNSICMFGGDREILLSSAYCSYGSPMNVENPTSTYQRISGAFSGNKMYPINDTSAFLLRASTLYRYDYPEDGRPKLTKLLDYQPTSVQRTPTGFIINFAGQSFYYTADPTGTTLTKASSAVGFAT